LSSWPFTRTHFLAEPGADEFNLSGASIATIYATMTVQVGRKK
jgi:hypothetical protein